jgi:hypothetical protein
MSEEGQRLAALRYFLRCYREMEPRILEELRALLSTPLPKNQDELHPLNPAAVPKTLGELAIRYHLGLRAPDGGVNIEVADEFLLTLLVWQEFPDAPNLWHFEIPGGERADPLRVAAPPRPYPFHFKADGWNPETESLKEAKVRLQEQFQAALEVGLRFWQYAETARSEARHFEKSTSPAKLRHLQWLAEKQATGLTNEGLAENHSCTPEAVSSGLLEAADLIGLTRKTIRRVPAGRKKSRQK